MTYFSEKHRIVNEFWDCKTRHMGRDWPLVMSRYGRRSWTLWQTISWWCRGSAHHIFPLFLFTFALQITLTIPNHWNKEVETPIKVSKGILQKENTSEGVRVLCDRHAAFRFGFYCCVAQEPLMLSSSLSTSVAGNITAFTLLKATCVTKQPGGAEWPWSLLRIFPPCPAAHKVKERAPRPPSWTSYKGRLGKLWLTTGGLVPTFHEEGEKLSCESTLHHSTGKQGLSSSGQTACQTHETCWSWKVYSGLSFLCDYLVSLSSQLVSLPLSLSLMRTSWVMENQAGTRKRHSGFLQLLIFCQVSFQSH